MAGMLKGKTALVTGSTGGIGEAFARAFAAEGCNVMMNGLGEPAAIEKLRQSIADEHGVKVAYHGADVGKPAEIADMVRATETQLGAVDILVNNAVVRHYHKIEDFPPEEWDRAVAVDLSAAFHTIRLTMRGMKQRGWGRIINIASVHGLVASAGKSAYGAAKRVAKEAGSLLPPKHILNAPTKLMKEENYGRGYAYDHDQEEAFSGQDYFPEELGRQTFYDPPERGFEREIRKRLDYWARLRKERAGG